MRKKLLAGVFALTLALSLLPGTAGAASVVDSGTCGADGDNVTWSLDSDGVLTISGTGKMADYTAGWNGFNLRLVDTPWTVMSVKSVVVEQGVTRIGNCAFAHQWLDDIQLPEGLEEIGRSCFWAADGPCGIDQITIPSTVNKIDGKLFVAKSISVADNNLSYSSKDGVLFSKDMKTLLDYPCERSVSYDSGLETYTIPSGVTTIADDAFSASFVTITEIPEGVTSIGERAFSWEFETGGPNVSVLSLPSTLKRIAHFAFVNSHPGNVYYHGTEEMWNEIDLDDDIGFSEYTTIHYLGAPQPAAPYTITFDPNGGTVTPTTAQTNADGMLESLPTPTQDGYIFNGWYTAQIGGKKVSKTSTFTEDTVLYAHWTKQGSGGGGGGGGGGGTAAYAVNAAAKPENGSVTVTPKSAAQGQTVTITPKPAQGFQVDKVTVTDKNGKSVPVKDNGDGTYSFSMPASKVSVEVLFTEAAPDVPDTPDTPDTPASEKFVDVPADAWYHDAVCWAADNGVTQGTDETHFSPNKTCTRGQAMTFLWRAMGEPEPTSAVNPFQDVSPTDYYCKAILWAVENGITVGVDATHFAPSQTCSTAHIITFLYRALGAGANGWYDVAGQWATARSLLDDTGLTVRPGVDCPRSAMVTFLYRELANK